MMNETKIRFLDLIKHYNIISKYLLEVIHIILVKLIKYKLLIRLSSNQVIVVVTYFRTGIYNVMTKKYWKTSNFLKSTKTHSPSSLSGATSLPPTVTAFMYKETCSNNQGPNVFVSSERSDIIQSTNITFYHNRFSILTDDNIKNMGRFRIQFLLGDNTWSTQYTKPKNSQYSNSSTEGKLLNLDITVENYGTKFILDKINTAHSDMCFSNITITHSLFYMNNPNCFRDIFESIPYYRKIALLMFLIKNDKDLLLEIGFL